MYSYEDIRTNKAKCIKTTISQPNNILSDKFLFFFVNKIRDKKRVIAIPVMYIIVLVWRLKLIVNVLLL